MKGRMRRTSTTTATTTIQRENSFSLVLSYSSALFFLSHSYARTHALVFFLLSRMAKTSDHYRLASGLEIEEGASKRKSKEKNTRRGHDAAAVVVVTTSMFNKTRAFPLMEKKEKKEKEKNLKTMTQDRHACFINKRSSGRER